MKTCIEKKLKLFIFRQIKPDYSIKAICITLKLKPEAELFLDLD
jgi:hypothetical protein